MAEPEIESPFFSDEQPTYSGGTIKTNSNVFIYLIIAVIIIIIVWIMFSIFKQIRISGEDHNQRMARLHFNNIRGEDFDEEAKQAIEYGEAIENPRAIDHYRVGAVYLLNARDHQAAHRHFREALQQIINGRVNTREAPFILDRIDDFKDMFVDFPEVNELPLQQAMIAQFNHLHNQLRQVEKKKTEVSRDDPEFKQKTMLSRQEWQSDSQNVHDDAIYTELRNQVSKVRDENSKLKDIQLHDFNEAVNWLRVRYKDSPKKQEVEKVINVIASNFPVGTIPDVGERDLITAIWQRTFDPDNSENSTQIREAMGEAVLDCVERGSVVCITGRSSKIWQALARLDKDEEMGILKSKQAVRNEIYQKAAKIVDDFVGANGSASQALRTAYQSGDNTEQVVELTECMKKKIDDLRAEYSNLLPANQLDNVLKECKAVV